MKWIIISFFIINMLFGCSNNIKWTEKEKEQLFGQTLDIVNLYTSGKIKPILKSNKEHLEVTICTLKKIMNKYSYTNYFSSLADGNNDIQKETIKLNKFRLQSLIDCNLKFTELGYTVLVMQGLIKPSEVPK